MTLDEITTNGIDPAMRLLPPKMDTPRARVQILTIGLQESKFEDRRQMITVRDPPTGQIVLRPLGPAKSFWQAERGGGMVHGVRVHPASARYAAILYRARKVQPRDVAIWNAIERDDVLAAGLARLLLWTDVSPLPLLGDEKAAWAMYFRVWKPGKPKRETFPGYYQMALEYVQARGDL